MAAYAALVSLAQATALTRNHDKHLFSMEAEEKIRSIHEYVIFMLSFLEDFPERAYRWEGRIRDVAQEVEDIIEQFLWQARYIRMKPPSVNLEDQMVELKEEIGLIAGLIMEERPASSSSSSSSSSRVSSTGNDAVIGLDEDLMAMKEQLCGNSSKLQLIPIVGMAGIGKTTLARTVYEDPLILEYFDIRAWVVVSQDYTPHRFIKILLGILDSKNLLEEQLCGEKIDESEEGEEEGESEMATRIYQKLKCCRRYLVVMDDVWSTKVWDDVRNIFPDDGNGSRIVLTTRLLDLASYPDPYSHLHEMQFMDDEQSWDLLKQKVFINGNCPPELEDVGKQITRRCAGLPLAVVLVAGVLSPLNRTRASWEEIVKNVSPVFERELEEILSLSYTHLPYHLRACFLYMGGFPEDDTILASRLVKLWVAEGFLRHENGCLEEEAEECLEDLVKRNLVIVTSRKTSGKIKSCSLHDAVRDLCVRKSHEEKFLDVVDGHDLPQGFMSGGRRISSNHPNFHDIWSPTIRTIMCFQHKNSPSWLAFLQSSRLLKVLNVVGNTHEEFLLPSQVFRLFRLKYVALIGSFNIPSAISDLVNLQTLIIHPTRKRHMNLREYVRETPQFSLPLEIWKMQQLRHLILHDPYMLPHPPHASDPLPLRNLQTLLRVQNLVWNEKMVQMIPHVKKLGLVYTTDQEYHLHHLKHLLQLEKLQVIGYRQFSWWGQNHMFPRTLRKLTLVGGGFPWECLGTVGSLLPNLRVLKLRDHACHGVTWKAGDGEFPQLKYLLIDNSLLEQWIMQSSPFPMLQHLVLRSCRRLRKIPEGIGEILMLESVEVAGYCRSTLLESLEQIKKDQDSFGNDGLQVRSIDLIEIAGSGNTDITLSTPVAQLCRQFSFSEIRSYTVDFSYTNLIGEGGFGRLYKGVIDNGRGSNTTVAIKRLASNSNQGEREFAAEMKILANFRHHNLVSLIGYCSAEGEKVLVYEFMPNGTLADHLYRNDSRLSWKDRLKICIGAARGLSYLHSICGTVHGDVKTASIFLDEDFMAKLSDFSVGNIWRSHVSSSLKGNDPSCFTTRRLTRESDICAFGVVLLEVLSERRLSEDELRMTNWAREKIQNGEADQILALNLRGAISQDCLKTFVEVAERCLDHQPHKRFKMAQVVVQLEIALQEQEEG